jgi:parvulin-like peptidyl-prolyl isomerase
MKYLYYIAGILVIFSMLAVYGLQDTRVEISKPAIVVNDRIITESEFEALLPSKPYYMTEDQFIDSIITKQLLIQEGVKQEINKEESFRASVENYYEQSLIKLLLDRQLTTLAVEVTEQEIERYLSLSQSNIHVSKLRYETLTEALAGENPILQKIESDFTDISDDLKFIVFTLEKGQSSAPFVTNAGVIVYRLEEITPKDTGKISEIDMGKISLFIQEKKKEVLMDDWAKKLKENAEIWRQK